MIWLCERLYRRQLHHILANYYAWQTDLQVLAYFHFVKLMGTKYLSSFMFLAGMRVIGF